MTNTKTADATPTATAHGLTLYRFEMKIGSTPRTCEQWHRNQSEAENAAEVVLNDWRWTISEDNSGKVERVAPVSLAEAVERGIIKTPGMLEAEQEQW